MTGDERTSAVATSSEAARQGRKGRGPEEKSWWSRAGNVVGLPLLVLVTFFLLWDGLVRIGIVQEFLLPPPAEVGAALWDALTDIFTGGDVAGHFFTTLNEILVGFVLAVLVGSAIGVMLSEFPPFSRAFLPYIVAFNSTPKIAIAPLFIVWFGFGQLSKIVLVLLIAMFPIIINTMAGLKASDESTIRLMRSLGASRWETFSKVRLRNALPYFFAGLELAIVGASIGAVVGEFSGGGEGLGYLTLLYQEVFRLAEAFATIILLGLQGIVLHRLIVWARRKVVFWQGHGDV